MTHEDRADAYRALDDRQASAVLAHVMIYAPEVFADGIAYAMSCDADRARWLARRDLVSHTT